MRWLPFFLSCCLLAGDLSAQSYTTVRTAEGKVLKLFRSAQEQARIGNLEEAARTLDRVLALDPRFIDAHMEKGNVRNQQGLLGEAAIAYLAAIDIDSMYEPALFYSLGIVAFDQQQFAEAALHLQRYLALPGKKSERRISKARKYLADASFAAEAIRHPVPFLPRSLGPLVNTPESEYLPIVSADGESLVFTAVRNGQEDFYLSRKVDGVWQAGVPLQGINTPDNEGAHSIRADGQLMFFTACHRKDGQGGCDLYVSTRQGDRWSSPENIGPPVNTSDWESQPSSSADGNTLFFTQERRGSGQGKDIMVTRRQADGQWERPRPLPAPLNTTGDEQAPFLHADGQTLYFMSNGLPGMGGFDLYLSRLQADGSWSEPMNLGYPINTEGNEGALSVSLDGKTAFFATDVANIRLGDAAVTGNPQAKGTTDLYSFELAPHLRPLPVTYVRALTRDAVSLQPVRAGITLSELPSGKTLSTTITDSDGAFLLVLPTGRNYAMTVEKPGYLFHSENFGLSKQSATPDQPYLLEIDLWPVPDSDNPSPAAYQPVILNNVFFASGSAELLAESLPELDRLGQLLVNNPDLRIRILGHTDDIGRAEDNLLLSEKRAQAVYDHLLRHGIAGDRLSYAGFGETRPIAPNDSEEGRRRNRRTEFILE
ncbi:MAG: hypothetical protein RLY31_1295 [Bacteroidota bacterium]|jgi:outer membrane protein OmpA-like peptidoglycan-associated protein